MGWGSLGRSQVAQQELRSFKKRQQLPAVLSPCVHALLFFVGEVSPSDRDNIPSPDWNL